MSLLTRGMLPALAVVLYLAGPAAEARTITIASGPELGAYYPVANALKLMVKPSGELKKDRLTVTATEGSVENLKGLRAGRYQLAIVQADQALAAFEGKGAMKGDGPFTGLRLVLGLHTESMALVVRKDSGITSLDGIKGKTIDAGGEESGQYPLGARLVREFGGTLPSSAKAAGRGVAGLCAKAIDGAFFLMGNPNTTVVNALWRCDARLVPVDGPAVDAISAEFPPMAATIIPGGLYPSEPKDIRTLGVKSVLVARSDTPSAVVRAIVASVTADPWLLRNLDPALFTLDDAGLTAPVGAIPRHEAVDAALAATKR
jgi:uncharacterized protein